MIDYKGVQIHYRKGTKVMLIKAFDRSLFACVNNKDIYVPNEIATHKSKDLNPDYKKHRESYIPLMNQPCRRSALQNKKPCKNKTFKTKRARDGTRTRDPDLGKVVLHQLSHSRIHLLYQYNNHL